MRQEHDSSTDERSRRDFLGWSGLGLAGVAGAAALGQSSPLHARVRRSGKRRVTILFDSWNHMMPALAREMASRDHDLVLGDAKDGLAGEQDLLDQVECRTQCWACWTRFRSSQKSTAKRKPPATASSYCPSPSMSHS